MITLDRREFLALGACALGCVAATGCASVATTPVTPVDGAIRLGRSDVERLSRPGGYLRVTAEGMAASVYVLSLEDGSVAALSPICTHLGCTVDIAGSRLVCPCHGSTYARDGTVLRGPAERPLRRYPVEQTTAGGLVILLESQG